MGKANFVHCYCPPPLPKRHVICWSLFLVIRAHLKRSVPFNYALSRPIGLKPLAQTRTRAQCKSAYVKTRTTASNFVRDAAAGDVEEWVKRLRQNGFERVNFIHGKTGDKERLNRIQQWNAEKTDVMVATSAFGLEWTNQMSSWYYACFPGSVDRFYQGVGRGGRNGQASASFLLYTDQDLKTGKDLANLSSMLGVDNARARWSELWNLKRTDVDTATLSMKDWTTFTVLTSPCTPSSLARV